MIALLQLEGVLGNCMDFTYTCYCTVMFTVSDLSVFCKSLLHGTLHPKSLCSDLPALENDTNLDIGLLQLSVSYTSESMR